jgi:Ca-activated chloride channel family protein
MIALDSFALLRPWWLFAIPAVAMLFLLTRPKAAGLGHWNQAVDPPLLAAMLRRGGSSGGSGLTGRAIGASIVLTALALSGPAVRRDDTSRFRNLDATLAVIDLSADATGIAPLQLAKTAAHLVLDQTGARQIGLILYAGDAYLASPLTDDAAATSATIFALDDQTVPDPGVRPDLALGLARRTLRGAHTVSGDVVLISAGRGLDAAAMREARALADEGHLLHTLFVPPGAPGEPSAVARRAALAALAAAGHGVAEDVGQPSRVLAAVSNRAIRHLGASAVRGLAWCDVGRFLLIAAALPLLLIFRRSVR